MTYKPYDPEFYEHVKNDCPPEDYDKWGGHGLYSPSPIMRQRDGLIRLLRSKDCPFDEIMEATGLSRSLISRVVNG